tara:strand:+ start:11 stop:820 length:810 start_codon:yes stop_codon:yes gene_type:complete
MEELLSYLYELFFGNLHGVQFAPAFLATAAGGAVIGGVISAIGGLFGGGAKKRAARRAAAEKRRLEGKLSQLESNRQAIVNPYAGVKDLSSMAKDLSGMASNPYANLGVATQAAEMQIEQTDIALANTLDTIRATGAGAGGATALAQAALQSKKGVAAGIESQEASNEKMKAEGQSKLEQIQMSEAGRIQNIGMSEAGRMQQSEVAGKQFMFQQKEQREMQQLNRVQSQITGAAQQQIAAQQSSSAQTAGMFSALGNIASAYVSNAPVK